MCVVYRCAHVIYTCTINFCVSAGHASITAVFVPGSMRLSVWHVVVTQMRLLVGAECVYRMWVSERVFICASVCECVSTVSRNASACVYVMSVYVCVSHRVCARMCVCVYMCVGSIWGICVSTMSVYFSVEYLCRCESIMGSFVHQ